MLQGQHKKVDAFIPLGCLAPPLAVPQDQRCFLDNDTGDVVVQYKSTEIVRVAPSGDITLNTDGWFNVGALFSRSFPSLRPQLRLPKQPPTLFPPEQACVPMFTPFLILRALQPTTLASMNDALNVLGIRVTAPTGDVRGGEWSITDGRGLIRFFDGVVSQEGVGCFV